MFKNCFSTDMLATREIHLMAALSACAGAYYDFNVTKNVIIGTPVQIIDGIAYNIHEMVGLPEQCPYTQVIEFWGSKLAQSDQKAFFDFFSREHLVECYQRGERSIAHTYWTKDVLGNPMLAEQNIILYEDVTTRDLLGLTYLKDLTNFFRVEEAGKQALAAKEELEALNQALTEAKYATEQAYIAAEHANYAKTTFLSNMSHDIRTPMNAIIGFTSLAAKHLDNKELLKDYLGKIMVSSEHLLSLINDVLDMSRIESGKFKMEEKECFLPDIMHDIKNIMQTDIKAKRMDFYIDTVDVTDETIFCDKLRLCQILLNCLSNSMKFTSPGGMVGVRIIQKKGAPEGYGDYEFLIKDNGIGIGPDYLEHIFEPFTREQNSATGNIQGTGLGMSITKNVVDMMNGTIFVNSEVGVGTEISICLRFRTSENKHEMKAIKKLEGFRALIADDSMDNCASVEKMLRVIGMRPEWTTSGKEAVYRAKYATVEQGDPFKVYIIDWLMPDMNGIEVVRRIRKEIGEQVPIIILTAYDWSDIEEEARAAGVTAFCEKPLFLSELYDILQNVGEDKAPEEEQEVINRDAFRGMHVLLADDVPLNRELAVVMLEEAGFEVDTAENGKEVVERLQTAKSGYYDLVLMDVMMPVMDGYEATRQIRRLKDPALSGVPIIAMTANAFEEDRRAALDAGMNDHLAKPFRLEKLYQILKEHLNEKEKE